VILAALRLCVMSFSGIGVGIGIGIDNDDDYDNDNDFGQYIMNQGTAYSIVCV
jgi:hypothetical protein